METGLKSKDKSKFWFKILGFILSALLLVIGFLFKQQSSNSYQFFEGSEIHGDIINNDGIINQFSASNPLDSALLNYCNQIKNKARFELNNINRRYPVEGSSNKLLIIAQDRDKLRKIINLDCVVLNNNKYEIEDSLNLISNVYK